MFSFFQCTDREIRVLWTYHRTFHSIMEGSIVIIIGRSYFQFIILKITLNTELPHDINRVNY